MATMIIRSEETADADAIRALVTEAFGRSDEASLVDSLRATKDLAVSLVACDADTGSLIGHVALSPMRSPALAVGLAPLCVAPARQRQGIGSALVERALVAAADIGSRTVFVVGNPGLYGKLGFSAAAAAPYPCRYAGIHFLAVHLGRETASVGPAVFAPAFDRFG